MVLHARLETNLLHNYVSFVVQKQKENSQGIEETTDQELPAG